MDIKEKWKNSKSFRSVDNRISSYYRNRLKNDNFTILCSNCIGGCIYHRLGQKFLSPTINLMMSNPDFVLFCYYLSDYIKMPLEFVEDERPYPVAIIGGEVLPALKILFVHYKSREEAELKWYERIKRINPNNLFLIMYDSEIELEHIKMVEQINCKNKVMFSGGKRNDISWSKQIKPTRKHGYNYLFLDLFGRRYYEKKWDFVGFLNSENIR